MEKLYHRGGELNMCNPWDFSCFAQLEFPELSEYCFVNVEEEGKKYVQELGNPWGQDYYLYYKYTWKYQSSIADFYLYWVMPK